MSAPTPTVQQAIDGLYITLYNRAPTASDYSGWANFLGVPVANIGSTAATTAQFISLSNAFITGSGSAVAAYYNATYPATMSNTAFIQALYQNLGGSPGESAGVVYWAGLIPTQGRAQVVGEFVQAFESYNLTDQATSGLNPSDFATAVARQQTFNNKILVAEQYAAASAVPANSFLVPGAPSLSDPGFLAATNIIQGVTNDPATIANAEAQLAAATAAGSTAPILGQGAPGNPPGNTGGTPGFTFTLTGAVDTINTSATGATFNAPLVTSTLGIGQSNSLNPTDSIVDAAKDGVLTTTIGLLVGSTLNDAVVPNVTLNGVATANVSVLYNGGLGGLTPPASAVQVGGFAGTITGLTTVNDINSSTTLQLGLSNDGLGSVLQNLNVKGFTATRGSPIAGVLLAAGQGSLANTIKVNLQDSVYGTNASYGLTGGAYNHVTPPAPGTYSTSPTGVVGGSGHVTADTLAIGSDGAPGTTASPNLSYGTWALTTTGSDFLQLTPNADILHGALYNSNVNAATAITLAGNGNVTLGTDAKGNWAKLATIDASALTGGSVTINGAASGITSNAFGSLSLGGSAWGLLDGDSALTLFKGDPNGANWLDVSSENVTQIGNLVATGNTTFNNTIVVTSAVADTTSATTFAGVTNFQELAIGGAVAANGPIGTINMANLPTTISSILYLTQAGGAVFINNVTRTLTVDTENNGNGQNLTVGAVGPNAGYTDALNIIVGNIDNPLQTGTTAARGVIGAVALFGEETVGFVSQGAVPYGTGAGNSNDIGTVKLTPTPGGGEHVTITGDSSIAFGFPLAGAGTGAIFDFSSATGFDNVNDLTIIDTTAGTTYLQADFAGVYGTDQNFGYSTNAFVLDASGSATASTFGGLLMRGGDANFVVGNPVAAPNVASGDIIKGSLTQGNILIGSLGNDTITGGNATDTIGTNGGADSITLGAGHTGDHIALYEGYSVGGDLGGVPETALTNVTGVANIVSISDTGLAGWWGASYAASPLGGAGATPFSIAGSFAADGLGSGTSIDMSTVTGFNVNSDVLDFSVSSWGKGGSFTAANAPFAVAHTLGLLDTKGNAETAHTALTFAHVSLGATINNSGANQADVIVLDGTTFANADAVAGSLSGFGTAIKFTSAILGGDPLSPSHEGHFLLAYQNTAGNTVLADLDIEVRGAFGIQSTASFNAGIFGAEAIAVSDIVQLTGVTINNLKPADIHLVG